MENKVEQLLSVNKFEEARQLARKLFHQATSFAVVLLMNDSQF